MRVSIRFRDDVRTVAGTAASSRGHDAKYHDLRRFSAKPGKKFMKIREMCICIFFHVQYTRSREFDPSWNAEQVVYARTAPWTGQKKKKKGLVYVRLHHNYILSLSRSWKLYFGCANVSYAHTPFF